MASWDLNSSVRQVLVKRIVEDGNLIQQLISKIDLQLSTDQLESAQDTLNYLEATLAQLDADCGSLALTITTE